jgi:hypothetical protein
MIENHENGDHGVALLSSSKEQKVLLVPDKKHNYNRTPWIKLESERFKLI